MSYLLENFNWPHRFSVVGVFEVVHTKQTMSLVVPVFIDGINNAFEIPVIAESFDDATSKPAVFSTLLIIFWHSFCCRIVGFFPVRRTTTIFLRIRTVIIGQKKIAIATHVNVVHTSSAWSFCCLHKYLFMFN